MSDGHIEGIHSDIMTAAMDIAVASQNMSTSSSTFARQLTLFASNVGKLFA